MRRLVLDCPAEDLAAGGAKADLLERLRALRFLPSSGALGLCAVCDAPPPGMHHDDPQHVLAGVPFLVRPGSTTAGSASVHLLPVHRLQHLEVGRTPASSNACTV